jgi:cytochrome c-type biogenesis protein CcmH
LLEEGLSNEEIRQYLAHRYSAFILYQPEVNSTTYMLWSSPLLVLFVGLFVVMRLTKEASVRDSLDTPVVDQKRLKSLLDNGDSHG